MAILIGMLLAALVPCGAATPTLTTLYSFTGDGDGNNPETTLTYNATTGALYGTTFAGGPSGWGTVFAMTPPVPPSTTWTKTQIYSFTGGPDGANPLAGMVITAAGVLFGTTSQGGKYFQGTVFQLTPPTPPSTTWSRKTIYNFSGLSGDGMNPQGGLIMSNKVIYGTTYLGGTAGYGTVFSLTPPTPPATAWTRKTLYSFKGAPVACGTTGNPACDGANPEAGLALVVSNGVLYGTTYAGGALGYGSVFSLTPPTPPATTWTEKLLYSFQGSDLGAGGGPMCGTSGQPPCDGAYPAGALVIGKNGTLFGTTTLGGSPTACPLGGFVQGCGAVFQLQPPTPPATTWTESLIYVFGGPPKDGWGPSEKLAIGATGNLFGTTFAGGSSFNNCFPASYVGCGMVYSLKTPVSPGNPWVKNNLAIFNDANGGGPNGVILSTTGVLYGTTFVGGSSGGYGTVFQIVP